MTSVLAQVASTSVSDIVLFTPQTLIHTDTCESQTQQTDTCESSVDVMSDHWYICTTSISDLCVDSRVCVDMCMGMC